MRFHGKAGPRVLRRVVVKALEVVIAYSLILIVVQELGPLKVAASDARDMHLLFVPAFTEVNNLLQLSLVEAGFDAPLQLLIARWNQFVAPDDLVRMQNLL